MSGSCTVSPGRSRGNRLLPICGGQWLRWRLTDWPIVRGPSPVSDHPYDHVHVDHTVHPCPARQRWRRSPLRGRRTDAAPRGRRGTHPLAGRARRHTGPPGRNCRTARPGRRHARHAPNSWRQRGCGSLFAMRVGTALAALPEPDPSFDGASLVTTRSPRTPGPSPSIGDTVKHHTRQLIALGPGLVTLILSCVLYVMHGEAGMLLLAVPSGLMIMCSNGASAAATGVALGKELVDQDVCCLPVGPPTYGRRVVLRPTGVWTGFTWQRAAGRRVAQAVAGGGDASLHGPAEALPQRWNRSATCRASGAPRRAPSAYSDSPTDHTRVSAALTPTPCPPQRHNCPTVNERPVAPLGSRG